MMEEKRGSYLFIFYFVLFLFKNFLSICLLCFDFFKIFFWVDAAGVRGGCKGVGGRSHVLPGHSGSLDPKQLHRN